MATLASWSTGTLPTIFGTTVTAANGGGPTSAVDAIQVAQDAGAGAGVTLAFTSRVGIAVRTYFRTPSSWPSSAGVILGARPDSSNLGGRMLLAGTSAPGQVRLGKADPYAQVAASANNLLSASTWYRFCATFDQAGGRGRAWVFPLGSDTAIWDSGWITDDFGAAVDRVQIGALLNTPTIGTIRLAAILVSDDVTGPVGRASWDSPLDTPAVTITGTTVSTGSDGTVSISWPAVTGATSYDVGISDTNSQEGVTVVANRPLTPRTYTFTGLAPGTRYYAVRAKA